LGPPLYLLLMAALIVVIIASIWSLRVARNGNSQGTGLVSSFSVSNNSIFALFYGKSIVPATRSLAPSRYMSTALSLGR
jgi:hypothetical protein